MASLAIDVGNFESVLEIIAHENVLLVLGLPHCKACAIAIDAVNSLENNMIAKKAKFVIDLDDQEQVLFIIGNKISEFPAILIYENGAKLCGWSGVYSDQDLIHQTINAKLHQLESNLDTSEKRA